MDVFLIADDSPVIRKVARRLIEDLGFSVVEAADGDALLGACLEAMPRAVLIDWDMPGTDSIEAIRTIRRMPNGSQPTLLYCTSGVQVSEMTRAKRAGASGFLMKPFNRKLLVDKFIETGLMSRPQRAA